jgi:hypothetical protein
MFSVAFVTYLTASLTGCIALLTPEFIAVVVTVLAIEAVDFTACLTTGLATVAVALTVL